VRTWGEELMSNAKVIPSLKERGINPRRARLAGQTHGMWHGLSAVIPANSDHTLFPERKVVAGMPLLRLNRVLDFVDANIALDLSVPQLATVAGMSPYYFCRSFKQSTGTTPHRYVLHRRIEQAKRLLGDGAGSLLDIAQQIGFTDQSQFTRIFHKMVGITPAEYRKLRTSA